MPVRTARSPAGFARLALLLLSIAGQACAPARAPLPGTQNVAGLTIDNAALRQWRFLYSRVSGVEWMTCLYGRVESTSIHVERSELADVVRASYAGVMGSCGVRPGTELIGLAHSHPPLPDGRPSCRPSDVDAGNLGRPWRIVIVVCATEGDAVTVGYRAAGRNTVVRTFTAPDNMPPLVLGDGAR